MRVSEIKFYKLAKSLVKIQPALVVNSRPASTMQKAKVELFELFNKHRRKRQA